MVFFCDFQAARHGTDELSSGSLRPLPVPKTPPTVRLTGAIRSIASESRLGGWGRQPEYPVQAVTWGPPLTARQPNADNDTGSAYIWKIFPRMISGRNCPDSREISLFSWIILISRLSLGDGLGVDREPVWRINIPISSNRCGQECRLPYEGVLDENNIESMV